MSRYLGVALVVALAVGSARAEADKESAAVIDKAVKALGGEEALSKAKVVSWKSKGKITIGGNESEFKSEATAQGVSHYRSTFEGEFGGNAVKGVTVLAGDKGWSRFNENKMDLDEAGLAREKRTLYLQVVPTTLLSLKGKGFKAKGAKEEKVDGKPAAAVEVTGPDDKTFTLYFDKASGLPVKLVAKVTGFMGEEFTQETIFADYKDFKGVKKATKVVSKRDGEPFLDTQVTAFEVLDKAAPKTFDEPE